MQNYLLRSYRSKHWKMRVVAWIMKSSWFDKCSKVLMKENSKNRWISHIQSFYPPINSFFKNSENPIAHNLNNCRKKRTRWRKRSERIHLKPVMWNSKHENTMTRSKMWLWVKERIFLHWFCDHIVPSDLQNELNKVQERLTKLMTTAQRSGDRPESTHSVEEIDELIRGKERKIR